MSSPKFTLEVVTPDGVVFSREINYFRAPGSEGQFGVLANHAPFLTGLEIGFIEIKDDNQTLYLATSGGFSEILPNKSIILAETAELSTEIDVERAKASMERAKKRLESSAPETDIDRAQIALMRAVNRINVAGMN